MKRWGTVKEAAEFFGVKRQRIHVLMQKKALGDTRLIETPRGSVWLSEKPFTRKVLPTGINHRWSKPDGGLCPDCEGQLNEDQTKCWNCDADQDADSVESIE